MQSSEAIKQRIEQLIQNIGKKSLFKNVSEIPSYQPPSVMNMRWPQTRSTHSTVVTPKIIEPVKSVHTLDQSKINEECAIMQEHVDALQKRESELLRKIEGYQIKMHADEEMIDQLKKEIGRLASQPSKEIEEKEIKLQDELVTEINRLKELLKVYDNSSSSETEDRDKIIHLQKEVNNLLKTEQELQERLVQKKDTVRELSESTTEFLSKVMKDQENQLTEISHKNAKLLYERKTLQKQVQELNDHIVYLQETIQQKDKTLQGMQMKPANYEEQLSTKDDEISRLYQQINLLQQKRDTSEDVEPVYRISGSTDNQETKPPSHESINMVNRFVRWLKKPVIETPSDTPDDD